MRQNAREEPFCAFVRNKKRRSSFCLTVSFCCGYKHAAFGINSHKVAPQEPDGSATPVKNYFPSASGATYSVISPVLASTNICLSIREFLGGIQSFLTSQFE